MIHALAILAYGGLLVFIGWIDERPKRRGESSKERTKEREMKAPDNFSPGP